MDYGNAKLSQHALVKVSPHTSYHSLQSVEVGHYISIWKKKKWVLYFYLFDDWSLFAVLDVCRCQIVQIYNNYDKKIKMRWELTTHCIKCT